VQTIAEDHVALLGRLCGGSGRRERLALLGTLLDSTEGIWSPEAIRRLSPLDGAGTESALGSLKRAGVLIWDQRAGGYRVPTMMRPAVTALYLLLQPTPAEELIRAQAALFAACRNDPQAEGRTLIGLCEILADDVMHLDDLAGRPLAEQTASAELLERHIRDAEALLAAIAAEDAHVDVVGRALDLVGELARGVSALLMRLAAHSADHLPHGRHVPAELRTAVRALPLPDLAAVIFAVVGCAPRLRALPDETGLARALRMVRNEVAPAPLPNAAELRRAGPVEAEPDALARLRMALDGHPGELTDLVGHCGGWEEGALLHHGAVRLHEDLIGRGGAGLSPDGSLMPDPAPEIAHVSIVTLPVAA